MERPPPLAEKIRDESLLEFAEGQSQDERPVLIELDLPEPKVELPPQRVAGAGRPLAIRVAPETAEERAEKERRIAQAAGLLAGLRVEGPTWIPAAHTFVAKVNPAQ